VQTEQLMVLRDNVTAARMAFTIINKISNALRREPADTVKLKRAGESMEFYLRNLEELCEELDIDGAVHNSHGT
jgi:DNA-binding Xre family transcriptional regulator